MTKKTSIIRKANELVEARYRLNLWEMRVFLSMISMIKPRDEDFQDYRIYLTDVIDTFEINSNASYALLREAGMGLLDRKVTFPIMTEDGPQELTTHMVVSVTNFKHEGSYITLSFHPKMKPLLLELKKRYLSYDAQNILSLPSVYSIRIYELLKQYEKIGSREFFLTDLKTILGIENQYKQYTHLRQRILDPAQENLSKHCDISFTYTESKKRGRKVLAIRFTIISNIPERNKKVLPPKNPKKKNELDSEVKKTLFSWGVSKRLIAEWCVSYPLEQITHHMEAVEKNKNVKNRVGYLRTIIDQPIPIEPKAPKKRAKSQNQVDQEIITRLQNQFKPIWDERAKESMKSVTEDDWTDFAIWVKENPFIAKRAMKDGKLKSRDSQSVQNAMQIFLSDQRVPYEQAFIDYGKEQGYDLRYNNGEYSQKN